MLAPLTRTEPLKLNQVDLNRHLMEVKFLFFKKITKQLQKSVKKFFPPLLFVSE